MSIGNSRNRSRLEPSPKDWLLDGEEISKLLQYIQTEVTIDNSYDIPYTAGYSQDAKTIYIDKEVPRTISVRKTNDRLSKMDVDLFISFAVHEMTEKSLEAEPYNWFYDLSHEAALHMERLYVESIGADWNDYNEQTLKIVDDVYSRPNFPNCPEDLDIEPYIDEDDDDCLEKMNTAGGRDFDTEEDEANKGVEGTDEEDDE